MIDDHEDFKKYWIDLGWEYSQSYRLINEGCIYSKERITTHAWILNLNKDEQYEIYIEDYGIEDSIQLMFRTKDLEDGSWSTHYMTSYCIDKEVLNSLQLWKSDYLVDCTLDPNDVKSRYLLNPKVKTYKEALDRLQKELKKDCNKYLN